MKKIATVVIKKKKKKFILFLVVKFSGSEFLGGRNGLGCVGGLLLPMIYDRVRGTKAAHRQVIAFDIGNIRVECQKLFHRI